LFGVGLEKLAPVTAGVSAVLSAWELEVFNKDLGVQSATRPEVVVLR
jgi:hypothetical protein